MNATLPKLAIIAAALALVPGCASQDPVTRTNAANASASQITRDSREGLASLYSQSHSARALGSRARAVLVFPNVTRAGFVFGGQAGNGAMIRRGGSVDGFYQTASASWGLQAGVQRFGYALFLMDEAAVRDVNRAGGWELGGSPSLVVVDRGMATSLSTTTINSGTYAFFFDQRGLMAGLGLQGTKITRINPGR
jgi:lipid-binding SYLF domain-containing protein